MAKGRLTFGKVLFSLALTAVITYFAVWKIPASNPIYQYIGVLAIILFGVILYFLEPV